MTPLFSRTLWYLAAAILFVGALSFACHTRDERLIAEGRNEGRTEVLKEKLRRDSSTDRLASAVVKHDTVVLTKWVTKYDTVRRTLKLTDTIAVKQFITVADSTIKSCRESVSALAFSCAAKDSVIATQRALLAAVPRGSSPIRRAISVGIAGGYGATVSGGRVVTGPSLTAGVVWTLF